MLYDSWMVVAPSFMMFWWLPSAITSCVCVNCEISRLQSEVGYQTCLLYVSLECYSSVSFLFVTTSRIQHIFNNNLLCPILVKSGVIEQFLNYSALSVLIQLRCGFLPLIVASFQTLHHEGQENLYGKMFSLFFLLFLWRWGWIEIMRDKKIEHMTWTGQQ